MSAPRVIVVQTGMPAYRQQFVDAVVEHFGDALALLVGGELFASDARTALRGDPHVRPVANRFLFRRRALWQHGVVRAAVAAPLCVIEINPRILSNWAILALRGLRRRPTLMWGHAWSRRGEQSGTNRLRMWMCRRAGGLLVYTETDRAALARRLPGSWVWTAPNAIERAADMQASPLREGACEFVVSGRLSAAKKPLLALEAFAHARGELPPAARLVFVGDGPLAGRLRARATELDAADQVELRGEVFDRAAIAAVYAGAVASLSPGYVGLSMTQSHAHGVPMIYARDEPHAPEVEAAREGENALAVASDDAAALAAAMIDCATHRAQWSARRAAIASACRARYSVEAMAAGFAAAVEALLGERG